MRSRCHLRTVSGETIRCSCRSFGLEPVEARGQESAVRRGDARPVDLPLQNSQLVAQRQYLDVLVHMAHRQQPNEGEHTQHGEVGQSQQHDPPARHAHPAITGRSRQSAGHRPWMGFSAPAGEATAAVDPPRPPERPQDLGRPGISPAAWWTGPPRSSAENWRSSAKTLASAASRSSRSGGRSSAHCHG